MIKITVSSNKAFAEGPFPFQFIRFATGLGGRKKWDGDNSFKFEASGNNIRVLKESGLEIDWIDDDGELARLDALANLPKQADDAPPVPGDYQPRVKLFTHQQRALDISWQRAAYAYLLEMGLGKTAIALHNAGALHKAGEVNGVLILAPKGVHRQWLEQQLPEHFDPAIPYDSWLWKNNSFMPMEMPQSKLVFFAMNIDAIRTDRGFSEAKRTLKSFGGKSMMIIDESHQIKSGSAQRTKAAFELGKFATYRRILTGTPITKNIMDAWSQFKFLDANILGQPYMTGFRARYAIMGGWENKQIVGTKNLEEFNELIAPHSFRLTKAEALDLPPKLYATREYEMSEKTSHHYENMKYTFMTELENGTIVDAAHAAVAIIRLQQILSGYLPHDKEVETFSGERLNVLLDIIEQVEGPVIVWARFIEDIKRITEALSQLDNTVNYYGGTAPKEREEAVTKFLSSEARFFVANQATGGVGLNLQGACRTAIYYSNDFNAASRWQSEDRIHRLGTTDSVTYFDIVAQKSVDRLLLRSLKSKKSLADLTLDQIRQGMENG